MSELVFRVPACEWWSTNQRVHYQVRASNARAWRRSACISACNAMTEVEPRNPSAKQLWLALDEWTCEAHLAWGDRRMRDPHNYAGTVIKACIDGLVDAGIAVADDSRHLLATSQARHPSDGKGFPPGVYLTVRAATVEQEAS